MAAWWGVVVAFVYVLARVAQGWHGVLYLGVGLGSVPIDVASVPHLGGHFRCGFWIVPKACW